MNNLDIKKIALYAGIAIIIICVALFLWKKSGKLVKNKLTEAAQERQLNIEINESNVSLSDTEINNLVAKLKSAFGKYGWATDEDAVYDAFEAVNTKDDVLALVRAFAVQDDHTLNEWMNEELSSSEMQHVQEILTAKGIVYQF